MRFDPFIAFSFFLFLEMNEIGIFGCFSLTRFFTLPNDDWHEKAQSLDFFCCGAGDCDGGKSDSLSTAAPSSSGQCFLADSYFLLDESQTKETVEETEGGLLQCKHCLSELGCRFTSESKLHSFILSKFEIWMFRWTEFRA